jgi:hypothetical protein
MRAAVPVLSLALFLAVPLSPAGAAGPVLYALRLDGAEPLALLEGRGVVVRHAGTDEVIVEGPSDLGPELAALGVSYDILGDVDHWEELYLCYSASSSSLDGVGDVLWTGVGGAVIVGAKRDALDSLRVLSFMARPLPRWTRIGSWFDETPPPLIGERGFDREARVRGIVDSVLSSVSADSLAHHVARLSRYPGGALKSRYVLRSDCLTEAKPYIMETLASYFPAWAAVDTQRFGFTYAKCGEESSRIYYPADNIVGILPGTGALRGAYIICAHYDATAARSFPDDYMWWCGEPAPGADDNASGVATVLEAARVLSGLTFPFDLRFILFSGEEEGLVGSQAYADSVEAQGDTIYGVIDVDMVGYKRSASAPDTCHIVTNRGTRWLADWLVSTAEVEYADHFPNFEALRIDEPLAYSDHASFWQHGYDALVAIEHAHPANRYPYYHTVRDTLGHVYTSQLAGVARLVAGSVARLADPDVRINLAVFEGDIAITPPDLVAGSVATVQIDVHVFGPEESVAMTVEAWDGAPDRGTLLASFSVDRVMGGGEVISREFPWVVQPSGAGEHEIHVRVTTEGTQELTTADNAATRVVWVSAPGLYLMDHYVYPNPAPRVGDLAFRYELSRGAFAAMIRVYDLLGQELGEFVISPPPGSGEGTGTGAGWNTVPWTALRGAPADLASGIYIYRLTVYETAGGELVDDETGKFAIVR